MFDTVDKSKETFLVFFDGFFEWDFLGWNVVVHLLKEERRGEELWKRGICKKRFLWFDASFDERSILTENLCKLIFITIIIIFN
jgi:hypothetical protein